MEDLDQEAADARQIKLLEDQGRQIAEELPDDRAEADLVLAYARDWHIKRLLAMGPGGTGSLLSLLLAVPAVL